MGIYDKIFTYNELALSTGFRRHFKEKLKPSRGFGYWCWKPQIILQTLEKMSDGDILQYTDVGCHLNKNGVERLNKYFEIANLSKTGILAFQAAKNSDNKKLSPAPNWLVKYWTKGDVFDYFGVRNNQAIYNTGTVIGGVIFIKKTPVSLAIIEKWLQVYYDNFSLADDSLSKSPNFKGFIQHRHDQSIFSIIAKINNITTVSNAEVEFQELTLGNYGELSQYPILAVRDKDYGEHKTVDKIINRILRIARLFHY
jgi:hypothetical protein